MATLPGLKVGLSLDSATFVAETRRVQAEVSRVGRAVAAQGTVMERSFAGATRGVALLGRGLATIGIGIGVSALVGMTKSAISAGAALQDVADRTGVAVEELQKLRHAATLTGSSAAALDQGLERFTRSIGQAAGGSGALARMLNSTGVEIRDSGGAIRDTSDILLDYADAVAAMQSPAERAAAANAAFGRSGLELVGMLAGGRAAIEQHGAELERWGLVTDESAQALARADDAIERFSTRLSTTWTSSVGNAIILGEDFVDMLSRMGGGGSESLRLAERQIQLSAAIADAAAAAAGATGNEKRLADARLATLRAQGQLLVDEVAALQATERAQQSLRRAVPPTTDAFEAQAAAVETAARATEKLATVERGLLTQFRSDPEADRRLRQLRAEHNARERMVERLEEQKELTKSMAAEQARAQERMAEQTARLMEVPMRDASPEAQRAAAEAFRMAMAA